MPRLSGARPAIDLQTLQAVVSNRYDLLARYARATRKAFHGELMRLGLSAPEYARFAGLKKWLTRWSAAMPEAHQQTLAELMGRSGVMKTLIEMRDELAVTWQHAASSRDEMLSHLQHWIARAEASGIQALQEAAARIRRSSSTWKRTRAVRSTWSPSPVQMRRTPLSWRPINRSWRWAVSPAATPS